MRKPATAPVAGVLACLDQAISRLPRPHGLSDASHGISNEGCAGLAGASLMHRRRLLVNCTAYVELDVHNEKIVVAMAGGEVQEYTRRRR